jgi:hypothetical protein
VHDFEAMPTAKPPDPAALRAAKLSRVPGVTIAVAAKRFRVTPAAVSRARKLPTTAPTIPELALAALTRNGADREGELGDLAALAGWIDYINHDGCTAAGARAFLDLCPELAITGTRWRLITPWP